MKIKWKVAPKPTGQYRSFEKRGWPSGFIDDKAAFSIVSPSREGYSQKPLEPLHLYVAIWRLQLSGLPTFDWRKVKGEFSSVEEAKAKAAELAARGINRFV